MKITVQDYRRKFKQNTGKPRRGMDGQNWTGWRGIVFG